MQLDIADLWSVLKVWRDKVIWLEMYKLKTSDLFTNFHLLKTDVFSTENNWKTK